MHSGPMQQQELKNHYLVKEMPNRAPLLAVAKASWSQRLRDTRLALELRARRALRLSRFAVVSANWTGLTLAVLSVEECSLGTRH